MSEEAVKESVELNDKQKKILESIDGLTVVELASLVKALEEKYGVSAAAPVAVAAGAAGAAAGGEAAEEQTAFSVVLESFPADKKIAIIKVVREITSLGLKEAKEMVEGAPKPVKEGAAKDEAEKIKKDLETAGAKVSLK
jgi:large subunit ribosomal protein L7/L12